MSKLTAAELHEMADELDKAGRTLYRELRLVASYVDAAERSWLSAQQVRQAVDDYFRSAQPIEDALRDAKEDQP